MHRWSRFEEKVVPGALIIAGPTFLVGSAVLNASGGTDLVLFRFTASRVLGTADIISSRAE